MANLNLTQPIIFEPLFMERPWGGRRLETQFGKRLPPKVCIGESWEIVDRPEAQSIVRDGPLHAKTLHELWTQHQEEIFGDVAKFSRFPLLIKLLDAQEKLSLQVHPPENIARKVGSEPKTEFWYVAVTDSNADLFIGLRKAITRNQFEEAVRAGTVADHVHKIPVTAGNAMFLPAGRLHAVGAGNLLVEIQQNSDTTYRVFDWNRIDENGKARQLHVDQALQCINFDDIEPKLIEPKGELLVRHELFEIQKWDLNSPREIAPLGQFAIIGCLTGLLRCSDIDFAPGKFCLLPASSRDRQVSPRSAETSLLRVTIP
jgi:mannose-6-phosphate isomerase